MRKFLLLYLLICLLPVRTLSAIQSGPVGWASVYANEQNGTNGGAGGTVVTVSNMTDLITYCGMVEPYIIQVEGLITLTPKGRYVSVRSNKTIIGVDAEAGISQGGFRVGDNQQNIIFRNLTISDTFVEGDWAGETQDWDGIQIKGTCHHIWVDHCTFLRQGDGALDITNGADYITVSNSKFAQNNKVSLIGSSDSDTFTDRYKVTMHHNWFEGTTQRNPRVRFGRVHLFNNYYHDMGAYGRDMGYAISNGYGIGVGVSSQIYSEHNYFEKCVNPSQFYDNPQQRGYIIDIGSHFVQSGTMLTRPNGMEWNPADVYEYSPDAADQVKDIVMARAGAGQDFSNSLAVNIPFSSVEIRNYPNPFSDFTTLEYVLPQAGSVRLSLVDVTGRVIREMASQVQLAGKHHISLGREGLKPGIYFVSLQFDGSTMTHRIAIY